MNRRTFLGGIAGSTVVGELLDWRMEWEVQNPQTSPIDDGPTVVLDPVVTGLDQPVALEPIPGREGSYVAGKLGVIHVYDGEDLQDQPLLDIRDQLMKLTSWEQGLLGLALHPDFENTRRYYVRYSAPRRPGTPPDYDHTFVLSEFTATEDLLGTVPGSERTILEIPQYGRNHNAGAIEFGPDGYLYVAVGDGNNGTGDSGPGHASDWYPLNGGGNGQDLTANLLGSILRIDVNTDGNDPYAVPPDNPLVGGKGLDEQYAWGFRNPYRMSFDGDDLYVGDVGQRRYEEINRVRRGGNYGWNVREGTSCYSNRLLMAAFAKVTGGKRTYPACPTTTSAGEPLIDPVVCYPHTRNGEPFGSAIIAGYRYRGADVPELAGKYVFGDVLGSLFAATPTDRADEMWPMETLRATTADGEPFREPVLSFGLGGDGELYVLTSMFKPGSGTVYRIRSSGD